MLITLSGMEASLSEIGLLILPSCKITWGQQKVGCLSTLAEVVWEGIAPLLSFVPEEVKIANLSK